MNQKQRVIKAQIFIEWLKFRLYPEEYEIDQVIRHGIKIVTLAKEMKKA